MNAAAPFLPEVHAVAAHDGVELAVAAYRPEGHDPVPAPLAATLERFDNNLLPAIPAFLFRKTRPIGFYGVGKDRTYLGGVRASRLSLPVDEPA